MLLHYHIYKPNCLGKPLKKNDQCQWSILNFFGVQPVFSDDALIAGRWWCWWCTVHWCIILVETYLLPLLHTNHHHYSTECTNTLVETPNTFWCRRKHCIGTLLSDGKLCASTNCIFSQWCALASTTRVLVICQHKRCTLHNHTVSQYLLQYEMLLVGLSSLRY